MNSTAWRFPSVMVPVLSSSSVFTSPDASTALPLMASTLCCITRSIPAMPIAESNPPMVVGIRQTSNETSTATVGTRPAAPKRHCIQRERLQRDHRQQKDQRQPAIRMFSAISFGVFCRSAPSTSAIMRSRNVSPGFEVIWIFT